MQLQRCIREADLLSQELRSFLAAEDIEYLRVWALHHGMPSYQRWYDDHRTEIWKFLERSPAWRKECLLKLPAEDRRLTIMSALNVVGLGRLLCSALRRECGGMDGKSPRKALTSACIAYEGVVESDPWYWPFDPPNPLRAAEFRFCPPSS